MFLSFPLTNVLTPSQQSPTLNNNLKSLAMSHDCWIKMRGHQKYDIIAAFLAPKVGRWNLVDEQTRSLLSVIHKFQHIPECLPEAKDPSKPVDEQSLCQDEDPRYLPLFFCQETPRLCLHAELGLLHTSDEETLIGRDKYSGLSMTLCRRPIAQVVLSLLCKPVLILSLSLLRAQKIEHHNRGFGSLFHLFPIANDSGQYCLTRCKQGRQPDSQQYIGTQQSTAPVSSCHIHTFAAS